MGGRIAKTFDLLTESFNVTVAVCLLAITTAFIGGSIALGSYLGDKQAEKATMLDYARFAAYNGGTVTGDEIVTAARKFSREPGFYIYVQDSTGLYGVDNAKNGNRCYTPNPAQGLTSNTSNYTCSFVTSDLTTEGSRAHIPFASSYVPVVLTDGSGDVTGLHFTKQ